MAHQIKPEGASKELHSCLGEAAGETTEEDKGQSKSLEYVGQQNGSSSVKSHKSRCGVQGTALCRDLLHLSGEPARPHASADLLC